MPGFWMALVEWWRDRPRRVWVATAYGRTTVWLLKNFGELWIDGQSIDREDDPKASVRREWWRPSEYRQFKEPWRRSAS